MNSIAALEAAQHFPDLLERVKKGERITIMLDGAPAALLIPIKEVPRTMSHREIVDGMRKLRRIRDANAHATNARPAAALCRIDFVIRLRNSDGIR